jgi:putative flippase GtrA
MTSNGRRAPGTAAPSSWRAQVARVLRYSTVSAISTTWSMVVLGVLVGIVSLPAGWSNVIATACGIVPSYELNRRWVWCKRGDRSFATEGLPFCALTFAGLGLSTLAVHVVNARLIAAGWSRGGRTAAIEVANLSAFGAVWVAQYVILDRLVFGPAKPDAAPRGVGPRSVRRALAGSGRRAPEPGPLQGRTIEVKAG